MIPLVGQVKPLCVAGENPVKSRKIKSVSKSFYSDESFRDYYRDTDI